VFEVKSGVIYMAKLLGIPETVWLAAETKAIEEVIYLYGKTFHLEKWTKGTNCRWVFLSLRLDLRQVFRN